MIRAYEWNKAARTGRWLTAAEIPGIQTADNDRMHWIDLEAPTPEEECLVFEAIRPIHPLELEDIRKPVREPEQGVHLPKVEEWDDHLFVIVNPLNTPFLKECTDVVRPAERIKAHLQLSAVLSHNVLITHHSAPLNAVDHLRKRIEHDHVGCNRGPDYLFHWLLDDMVDDCAPIVDDILADLDELEMEILADPEPRQLQKLLRLKSLVVILRKTLILEREVLARLTRGEFELVSDNEVAYYRNVYDHLIRYTELIEAAREMTSDLMQIHLSAVANRTNGVMKLLAMISTVILPMTLVASVYGMNFKEMPGLDNTWGFHLAIGAMGLCGVASFFLFRWKRWV